ncbi:MAG: gamma-glutamyl-gamma-aminobutyrate hydrolase family protein [Alphaproteobacteria bacterium]|nr:gamma-glutamyl-gamma-aminobutyrate hydrolase family protein [Alphaproteobacteria bacterium]
MNFVTKLQPKEPQITVVFPEVIKAVTGKMIQIAFGRQPNTHIAIAQNIIKPPHTAPLGDDRETAGIPEEWSHPDFKEQMMEMIGKAVQKVIAGDVVAFTGGRDYEPQLLGRDRHEKTDTYSIFDLRDVVETYMLAAAIAHGKTIHSTCRGYQVVTNMMLDIFADPEKAPFTQDIPSFYAAHALGATGSHHAGGLFGDMGLDAIIRTHQWFHGLLAEQLAGKPPRFLEEPGMQEDAAHDIRLMNPGLLRDALELAQKKGAYHEIREDDGQLHANVCTIHHQGFVFPDEDSFADFEQELAKAGGTVTAESGDARDLPVHVVEGVKFSKVIGPEELVQIQAKIERLNRLLGIDVRIPMPEIEAGQVIRVDIPHATQCHPELNIGGAALQIPALTTAFARAKQQAITEHRDLGGYDEWRKALSLDALEKLTEPLSFGVEQNGRAAIP